MGLDRADDGIMITSALLLCLREGQTGANRVQTGAVTLSVNHLRTQGASQVLQEGVDRAGE